MHLIDSTSEPLTQATQALFSSKTRGRILEQSLLLFNQSGFGSVTTATIAKEAEVLEGSLWYHFHSKKDILTAHLALVQAAFEEQNTLANSSDPQTIIEGVFQSYDVIWDFRYILRDDFRSLLKDDPAMLAVTEKINLYFDQWAEERIRHSHVHGVLEIPQNDMEGISEIILVIGRYWLDFSSKKYPETPHQTLRKKGLAHIFTVLQPYLNSESRSLVERGLRNR